MTEPEPEAPKRKMGQYGKNETYDPAMKCPFEGVHNLEKWKWIEEFWSKLKDSNLDGRTILPRRRQPGRWTIIRLFLSSTFVDTQAERDTIVKIVVPELNERLAKDSMWVRIEPEDLRWGVVGNTVRIQPTCLDLINKCQEDEDEMPWVVFLRTGRVGWVQEEVRWRAIYLSGECMCNNRAAL